MYNFFEGTTLDGLLGRVVDYQEAKASRAADRYLQAPTMQRSALHAPEANSAEDALRSGNASDPAAKPNYWDSIPKPLLYGSLALLGTGLLLQAVKK